MGGNAPTSVAQLAQTVDFSTVTGGMLSVFGALIGVYIIWRGAKFVIAAVRGG